MPSVTSSQFFEYIGKFADGIFGNLGKIISVPFVYGYYAVIYAFVYGYYAIYYAFVCGYYAVYYAVMIPISYTIYAFEISWMIA